VANDILIYGAGGHGKVVAEILASRGIQVRGFIDDKPGLVGSTVANLRVAASEWFRPGVQVALGIGDNRARERAGAMVKSKGAKLLTCVHAAAIVSRSVRIGEGAVIAAGAILNVDSAVGEGTIVNTGAIIEHDVTIGRYAHLSPNSTIAGGARVGDFTLIGVSASVLPLKTVGSNCTIGAGAVVIEDIPDNAIAYGIPAKPQK
jgi:sugar O-acyltransferase (sialic acid O-acetyltransferase NeuD family)